MQAFPEFRHMPTPFWAMVKYVSETLGYTIRGQGIVRTYSIDEIDRLLSQNGIVVGYETIESAKQYFDMRANLLNHQVQRNLMNSEAAKETFERLYPLHRDNDFKCKLPMNKQKGAMKQVAFFTAIINILTEDTLRRSSVYDGSLGFNDDPRGLVYVFDDNKHIIGASSRRFDGAYPNILNPRIVWEINGSYRSVDLRHIHLRYWNREYDWKYQHNTFLQPKKGQGRRCTEVWESRRHRYAYHRCIFDSGICHNFLERKGNVFHCYSGARHRLGPYLVCTVQVQ